MAPWKALLALIEKALHQTQQGRTATDVARGDAAHPVPAAVIGPEQSGNGGCTVEDRIDRTLRRRGTQRGCHPVRSHDIELSPVPGNAHWRRRSFRRHHPSRHRIPTSRPLHRNRRRRHQRRHRTRQDTLASGRRKASHARRALSANRAGRWRESPALDSECRNDKARRLAGFVWEP